MSLLNRPITLSLLAFLVSHLVTAVAVFLSCQVHWWLVFAILPAAALVGVLFWWLDELE